MAGPPQDEKPGGPVEWVVTFGDMMSLLLTFFIMLVSMSEIKEEQRYQALVESLRKRFGHEMSPESMMPGEAKPRNAPVKKMASLGRARRVDTMRGGDRVKAPVGENPRVKALRQARHDVVGGEISFPEGKARLDDAGQRTLRAIAQQIGGKPQKIEIRGHTSPRPLPEGSVFKNHSDLAYARCVQVMDYLVTLGINPKRIRLAVAGDKEPKYIAADPILRKQNSRVEIFLLDETVDDHEGTEDERQKRAASPPAPAE